MKWADIPNARDITEVYLRRLRIAQTPWFALYLHFIYLPDEDRDPHDHPFTFWSLVVCGGYTERVWHRGRVAATYTHRRGSVHRMPRDAAHTITHLTSPLVTLVFAGPKKQAWGFYTDAGFVPWQEYNRAKYGPDPGPDEFS